MDPQDNHIDILDGDVSESWRAVKVLSKSIGGWTVQGIRWPFGLTLKPGVDPSIVRAECAAQIGTKPSDIRLLWNPR